MTQDLYSMDNASSSFTMEFSGRTRKAKVAMLREEFFDLTQDPWISTVLNQLFYWSQRVSDFDLFLKEEITSHSKNKDSAQYGWFYKSATELSEETMLRVTKVTMRKYLHLLIEKGWISERTNPRYKWDRTAQYRVNLKALHIDLQKFGWDLPGLPKGTFASHSQEIFFEKKKEDLQEQAQQLLGLEKHTLRESKQHLEEKANDTSKDNLSTGEEEKPAVASWESKQHFEGKANDTSKVDLSTAEEGKPADASWESKQHFEEKANDTSKVDLSTFEEEKPAGASWESKQHFEGKANDTSKVEKVNLLYLTETTSENINREKHRTGARTGAYTREAEVDGASDREQELASPSAKVAALMVDLWRRHVNPEGIFLTDERKRRLESLLELHFQDDLRVWESFCLRVKAVPFLMGGGKQKWHVTLDWVLAKGNLLKVLEGNYDNSGRMEHQKNDPSKGVQDREIRALLDSIQDSFWKNWCSQLMGIHPITGGPLMDGTQPIEAVLTVYELKQITEARFMEFDGRLVWIECFDEKTLSKIEDLRFKISPVARATFPEARALRGHLHQPQFIQERKGEKHAE